MSRVRTLSGLYLTGAFNKKAITADKRAFAEYERLHKESVLPPPISLIPSTASSLTICLLNTRSLQLHASDIACVNEITESDVVCFTETQLLPNHDTTDICNTLDFSLCFSNADNRFQSIAYGVKDFDFLRYCDSYPGFLLIGIVKDTFCEDEIDIGLLYRLHSQPIGDFYDQLHSLVNSHNIHILLGDFNVDYFAAKDILKEVLLDYTMVVHEPTHIDGSLLDHIYIRNDWLSDYEVASIVKCVFFSDHDVIKIKVNTN